MVDYRWFLLSWSSVLANESEIPLDQSSAVYVLFKDVDADGSPSIGEAYIRLDGVRASWGPGLFTCRAAGLPPFADELHVAPEVCIGHLGSVPRRPPGAVALYDHTVAVSPAHVIYPETVCEVEMNLVVFPTVVQVAGPDKHDRIGALDAVIEPPRRIRIEAL